MLDQVLIIHTSNTPSTPHAYITTRWGALAAIVGPILLVGSLLPARLPAGEAKPPPAAVPAAPPATAKQQAFEPTAHYSVRSLQEWKVYVHRQLLEERRQAGQLAIELLGVKLYDINRALPAAALKKLHTVPIWLEWQDRDIRCACYHPSRAWLEEHGFNPEKAGAVEIGNAATFLRWSHEQPSMVLHELAHAYHDRFLGGYDNPEILAAYKRAVASKSYESVLYYDGRMQRAYALTDAQEYFAELSEAWFGTNDFYPFVRGEVIKHDPHMAELLCKLWGENEPISAFMQKTSSRNHVLFRSFNDQRHDKNVIVRLIVSRLRVAVDAVVNQQYLTGSYLSHVRIARRASVENRRAVGPLTSLPVRRTDDGNTRASVRTNQDAVVGPDQGRHDAMVGHDGRLAPCFSPVH